MPNNNQEKKNCCYKCRIFKGWPISYLTCADKVCVCHSSQEEEKTYARDYSHYHCWEQVNNEDTDLEKNNFPACGQPLQNHKQCCLCDKKPPQEETKECATGGFNCGMEGCHKCFPPAKETEECRNCKKKINESDNYFCKDCHPNTFFNEAPAKETKEECEHKKNKNNCNHCGVKTGNVITINKQAAKESIGWDAKSFDEKLSKSIAEMLDYGCETKDFHERLKDFITKAREESYKEGQKAMGNELVEHPDFKKAVIETLDESRKAVVEEVKKLITDEINIAQQKDVSGKTSRLTALYLKVVALNSKQEE